MGKDDKAQWGVDPVDSRVGRRPFLGSLGALGAATGLGGVGTALADHVDGWPSPDDPYYAGLVEELEGMGLPPADFVHADSESETREQYWAEAGDYGTIEEIDVSGDDVPFSQATRFIVSEGPENNWDVQLRTAEWASEPYRSVEAGDVFLGVAYLRAPEGSGTVQYIADNSQSDQWNSVVSDDYQDLDAEWQRYFFPIEFTADADGSAYEWSTQFHLGFDVQTVDVGGIALLDFCQDAEAADLPSGAVDGPGGDTGTGDEEDDGDEDGEWPGTDDAYYQELIDYLQGRDLSPGSFVYGNTEADTFAAHELDGSRTDGAETELLEVGDDVPFSEAIRIEITGEMENPWDVNFKGVAEEQAITDGDVLLGVAYLRTPDGEATIQHQAKDEDNEATNMSVSPRPSVSQGWERYFFPIQFTYHSEPGTWWTEFFLGYEGQTVDIGGLALFYFAQDVDVTDLPSWEEADVVDEEWEPDADERIEEHRTADLTVEVADADGNAIEGAAVDVAMQEHEYGFGVAVDADVLINQTEDGDEYREYTADLFNTAVLGNHHKWRFWENERDLADEATEWLLERGLSMRGHACLWASVDSWAVPGDVVDAMGIDHASGAGDPELDPDYVYERSIDHIEEIISHYGDDIEQWDVVNEVIHEPAMIEVIDGEDVDPVEAPILAEWYRTATEVAPEGVSLDVNDYNTLEGPYASTRGDYERQIAYLANADGVDLGGVGLQCHFSRSEALSSSEVMEGLDRYAWYGADLRITEFDMSDENWDEDDKAVWFHQFLKTVFSHPDTTDFVMWGIWDEEHWRDDAPLFYDDWTPKPTYEVYTDLVFDEWWTDESGTTDGDGTFSVTGFKGTHEVTVSHDGAEETATVTLTGDGETLEVTLDVDDDDRMEDEDDENHEDDEDVADDENETDGTDDGAGAEDDSESVPGFGAVPGLAALAGAAGYALFRDGDAGDEDER